MRRPISYTLLILILWTGHTFAEEKAVRIDWSAHDIAGAKVSVPVDGKVSIVAFLRADQPQSKEALKTLATVVTDTKAAQVVVVVSGESAGEQARSLKETKCGWPIVSDPEFSSSGKMSVHVWPTTVIVKSDGEQAGHLAGMPASYANDLQEYVSFAAGKIDQQSLQQRLGRLNVVEDTAQQAAKRHLQVATRLLEIGDTEQAATEIETGLKLAPQQSELHLLKAKLLINKDAPQQSLEELNAIPANSLPQWQIQLVRGRALVAMKRWEEAEKVLPESLALNPDPSEAYYLMGIVYQNRNAPEKAADAFRKAFESSPAGSKLRVR